MTQQQQVSVFVSHAHEDSTWCSAFVGGLHQAGADVWYDEHNLGYGRLMDEIERELKQRRVFLVVLSPAAVASPWVRREVNAAIHLHDSEPDRIVLPIKAEPCEVPLLWSEYRWLSGPGDAGLSPIDAAREVSRTLGIGQVARAPGQSWDEESLFASFTRGCTPAGLQAARDLYAFARARGGTFSWGAGQLPSVTARFFIGQTSYSVFSLYEWPAGNAVFALNFEYLQGGALPLAALTRLAERLRTIPKVSDRYAGVEQMNFKKRPALSLDQILVQPDAIATVEAAIDELLHSGQQAS
ncbi:MAG: toll/interleukin-1 receptor domain-containing protein [Ktedonobacterales bacterium]